MCHVQFLYLLYFVLCVQNILFLNVILEEGWYKLNVYLFNYVMITVIFFCAFCSNQFRQGKLCNTPERFNIANLFIYFVRAKGSQSIRQNWGRDTGYSFFLIWSITSAVMLHKTFLNDVWCSVWGWVGGVWGSL